MEPKNKIHLVSMTTPIRLGVVTTVDLGDTSLSQSQVPIAHAQLEQLVEDIFPMPPAGHSQHVPMVDLRSLRFKQGKLVCRNVVSPGKKPTTDMISREHLKFAKDRGASTKVSLKGPVLLSSLQLRLRRKKSDKTGSPTQRKYVNRSRASLTHLARRQKAPNQ